MKDSEAEAKLNAAGLSERTQADAGIEVIPEYETELLAAEVSILAPAALPPSGTPLSERPAGGALRRWTPILLKFASVQVVVQVIGFAAGILVIRNLPKREYALYTLCNTMLAAVLVLADSGISSALTAIGGRVWQDRARLSQLIRTALQLRRRLAAVALPVVISVLVWLLLRNGANVGKTAVLVTIVLLGCGLELITRIYAVALRLKSEIRQIQNQALLAAVAKFAIVALAAVVRLNVEIALLAVMAGFAVQYWMLRHWHTKNLDAHAPSDPEMHHEIVAVVRRQAPHTIYYCLQAQITVWLISIFGNADGVADVGALNRLAVVFLIFSSIASEVLFPAFARIQSATMVGKRYVQIILGFAALSLAMIAVVALFPGPVLSVLGDQYHHLQTEGILMAISSVLGAIAGLTWGLNSSRAWIIPPVKFIPVTLLIQVGLVVYLNLSTVRGVLIFSIFSALTSVVWAIGFALLRIHKLQNTV